MLEVRADCACLPCVFFADGMNRTQRRYINSDDIRS